MNLTSGVALNESQTRLYDEFVNLHQKDVRFRNKIFRQGELFTEDTELIFDVYFHALVSFWLTPGASNEDKEVEHFLRNLFNNVIKPIVKTKNHNRIGFYKRESETSDHKIPPGNIKKVLALLSQEISVPYETFHRIAFEVFIKGNITISAKQLNNICDDTTATDMVLTAKKFLVILMRFE